MFVGFYESELDVTCNFFLVDDGTYQCIPDPKQPRGPRRELHERGELYTGEVYVFADSPVPGCQPTTNDGAIYRLGAAVPIDGLGPLTRAQR